MKLDDLNQGFIVSTVGEVKKYTALTILSDPSTGFRIYDEAAQAIQRLPNDWDTEENRGAILRVEYHGAKPSQITTEEISQVGIQSLKKTLYLPAPRDLELQGSLGQRVAICVDDEFPKNLDNKLAFMEKIIAYHDELETYVATETEFATRTGSMNDKTRELMDKYGTFDNDFEETRRTLGMTEEQFQMTQKVREQYQNLGQAWIRQVQELAATSPIKTPEMELVGQLGGIIDLAQLLMGPMQESQE